MILIAFRELTLINQFNQNIKEELKNSILCYRNQYTIGESSSISSSDSSLQFVFEAFGQSFIRGQDFYFILFNDNSVHMSETLQHFQDILQGITSNANTNPDNIFENVDGIWSTYHSWGPCYDYINSHLSVKKIIFLYSPLLCTSTSTSTSILQSNTYLDSFPFNYICDTADYESDYSLDGGLWSTVKYEPDSNIVCISQTTASERPVPVAIPIVAAVSAIPIPANELQMMDLRHHMSALQIAETDAIHFETEDNEEEEEDNDEDEDDYDGDTDDSQSNTNSNITITSASTNTINISKSPRPGISYKDMVLRPPPVTSLLDPPDSDMLIFQQQSSSSSSSATEEKPKWRPKLVVTKVSGIRLDREYGPQSGTMVFDDDGNMCF